MNALRREALRGLNLVLGPDGQYRALCAAASTKDVYDLAIVGAGLTGAALAAGLGRKRFESVVPDLANHQACCRSCLSVAGSARLTRSLKIALIDRQVLSASGTCLIRCFCFQVYIQSVCVVLGACNNQPSPP